MTSSPKITLCRWAGSFEPVTRGVSNSTSRAPSLSSCGKENTQSVRKYHREHDASLQPGPRARPRVFLTNIESYLEKEEGQVPLRADRSRDRQAVVRMLFPLYLFLPRATLVYHFLPFLAHCLPFLFFCFVFFSYLF